MNIHPTRLLALCIPLALLAACASEPTTSEAAPASSNAPAPVATSEPVTAPAAPAADETPVRLTVREAQQRLLDKGYDPGVVDGISGPRTANALRQFQRDQGLVATGRLDGETMNALGR
jgi:peptidoglycan hydrolase-like protein with peptidoglycan-binding domain